MADNSPTRRPARSLRSAAVRAAVLIVVLIAALAAVRWTPLAELVEPESITELLDRLRASPWAVPIFIALYLVISPLGIPISPLILAGGAVFGLAVGWALNLFGALLGGAVTFLIGQQMGRDLIVHLLGAKRLEQAERLLEQHGFWAIVRIRFLPIPYALVNYGAALAGVRFVPFLVATAIGLAPSLVIYTTLSYALVTAAEEDRASVAVTGALIIAGVILASFAPAAVRAWRQRDTRQ